jgi:hypothetical protein
MFVAQQYFYWTGTGYLGTTNQRDIVPSIDQLINFSVGTWTAHTDFRYVSLIPGESNSTTGHQDTLQNRGWSINKAEMNITGGITNGYRYIPSGTWTFKIRGTYDLIDTDLGSNYKYFINVYKIDSVNNVNRIFFTESPGFNVTTTNPIETTWTTGFTQEIQFNVNETLYFEIYAKGRAPSAISSRSFTNHVGSGAGVLAGNFITPAPGIRNNLTHSFTKMVARGNRTLTRQLILRRTLKPNNFRGNPSLALRRFYFRSLIRIGRGIPVLTRTIDISRTLTRTARGNAVFNRRINMNFLFTKVVKCIPKAYIDIFFDLVPVIPPPIKRFIDIFDD